MRILQFIPFGPVPLMHRLLAQAARTNQSLPILDLEDTHWDIKSSDNTAKRKDKARNRFTELAESTQDAGNTKTKIAIRANNPSTRDFPKDLVTIKELASRFELHAIFLPKTSSASELQTTKEALKGIGQTEIKIIAIIESQTGLENIKEISDAAAAMGSESICYGHYDFHLDIGSWPLPTVYEPKFWEPAQIVIEQAMEAGLIYIQPPFSELHDTKALGDIISHLEYHCENRFHVMSAGPSQTSILARLTSTASARRSPPTPIKTSQPRELSTNDKDKLANEIQLAFVQSKRSQHSFTTDASSNRFIPPHEYAAALRYIEQREHA